MNDPWTWTVVWGWTVGVGIGLGRGGQRGENWDNGNRIAIKNLKNRIIKKVKKKKSSTTSNINCILQKQILRQV